MSRRLESDPGTVDDHNFFCVLLCYTCSTTCCCEKRMKIYMHIQVAYSIIMKRLEGWGLRGWGRGWWKILRFGSTYEKLVQLFKRVLDVKVIKEYKNFFFFRLS